MPNFRARYLFPVVQPPIQGGVISFDSVIRAVGADASEAPVDLGNVAIVPALVNAHAHLELSEFQQPLGSPGMHFPEWIREIIAWRRAPERRTLSLEAAVQRGERESVACGVGLVADIASPDVAPTTADLPHRCIFQEVLGLSTARADALYAEAERFVGVQALACHPAREGMQPKGCTPTRGLSPHAPYTVGIDLLERLASLSNERRCPLAMHLAESPEELELLRSHSGAFHSLLTDFGAWDPSAIPRGIEIAEYLRILSTAHRALVIHGNYLTVDEIAFLAAQRETMSVVYCPRTHAYFDHPRYPLPEMLRAGVRVAIGTDSRASSPDLNLWDDLRWVADTYPELSLDTILRLGTQNGAQAILGSSSLFGALQPSAPVLFQIVELPDEDAADPYELLFDSRSRVREVVAE